MQPYNIVLIRPTTGPSGQYFIAMAFHDIALLLLHSFHSLGFPCTLQTNACDPAAINVILGYHRLQNLTLVKQYRCILYQLEQLPQQRQEWLKLTDERLDLLQAAHAVWDFSPENIALLARHGLPGVKHLPFGYHEKLNTIKKGIPEIDVLFYGAVNARRKAVLDQLARRCKTKVLFGVYGEKRDRYISQARIVLNLHHHAAQIMEQPRISYLLNNGCFVVTEDSAVNPYSGVVPSAPYEALADCCLRFLDDPAERDRLAEAGHAFLAQRPMTAYLQAILE